MEAPAARVTVSRRRAPFVLPAFLALLLWAPGLTPAGATTVVGLSLDELCAGAERIFVGTVSGVRSEWADARKGSIETAVSFTEILPVLGEPTEEITLRFPGGEVDGVRESVSGMPRFEVGDRVVLFARAGETLSPLVGFNQGYFRVVASDAGAVVVTAGGSGPSLPAGGSAGSAPMAVRALQGVPLETFLGVVRDAVVRRGGRP